MLQLVEQGAPCRLYPVWQTVFYLFSILFRIWSLKKLSIENIPKPFWMVSTAGPDLQGLPYPLLQRSNKGNPQAPLSKSLVAWFLTHLPTAFSLPFLFRWNKKVIVIMFVIFFWLICEKLPMGKFWALVCLVLVLVQWTYCWNRTVTGKFYVFGTFMLTVSVLLFISNLA